MRNAVFGLVLTAIVTGCGIHLSPEVAEVRYASAEQGCRNEARFDCLPDWIPKAAFDIRLRYDIDTADRLLTFRLPAGAGLGGICAPANSVAKRPRLSADWWSDDYPGHADLACGDYRGLVRGDVFYGWATNQR
ncbi:hypothetical protein [Nocardia arthritidis]|uniref:YbbD head domain-containing protein n=1 Tax=Nocardia arthritidis TaxID=228602 RepID=A0A6G9YMA2_9NOCA|nr:hypothetical protein [Nocardia arthritidis]QIS14260.1 hypothetical protein F5544_32105 [Nocardia arthritidis]